jgi:nicotinate-nucleotide adenylyltransferase
MPYTPPRLLGISAKNLKIGLFGGTFNPPHKGHVHVCEVALKTGRFDFIWWMVTPGNPLKKDGAIPPFYERLECSRQIIRHPKIIVTDIENRLGTHKSIDTVRALKKHFPDTEFTFIAGMDNALHLHHWENWRLLMREIPFLFVARPPALNLVKKFPARMQKNNNVKWILETKLVNKSSTEIRAKK